MGTKYLLRLNDISGYPLLLQEFFASEDYPRVFAGHHVGKTKANPHYHVVFETNKDVKTQAMRKRLNTVFNKSKGNAHLSLKEWDGNMRAISYIYHEDALLVPFINKQFTSQELSTAQLLCKEVQEEIRENSPLKICDEVYQIIKSKYSQKNKDESKFHYFGHEAIFKEICLATMRRGDWRPNKWQFERYISKVQEMASSTPESREKLISVWYADMFPTRNF